MKAVILAGGFGTRLSEETNLKPKPMVEIGDKPILWHIMKMYSFHGVNEFIICAGYKQYVIKEYFSNYFTHNSDITIDIATNDRIIHRINSENWKVSIIDTGTHTMTGGRLKRVAEYLNDDESFFFTYGDGVGDIDISELLKFHKGHGKLATLTASRPPGRFGALNLESDKVVTFKEKPKGDGSFVNSGFFVLEKEVIELISDDTTIWEEGPLERLAVSGNLMAYKNEGFWQPMDTLRDKRLLEKLWSSNKAPWKKW